MTGGSHCQKEQREPPPNRRAADSLPLHKRSAGKTVDETPRGALVISADLLHRSRAYKKQQQRVEQLRNDPNFLDKLARVHKAASKTMVRLDKKITYAIAKEVLTNGSYDLGPDASDAQARHFFRVWYDSRTDDPTPGDLLVQVGSGEQRYDGFLPVRPPTHDYGRAVDMQSERYPGGKSLLWGRGVAPRVKNFDERIHTKADLEQEQLHGWDVATGVVYARVRHPIYSPDGTTLVDNTDHIARALGLEPVDILVSKKPDGEWYAQVLRNADRMPWKIRNVSESAGHGTRSFCAVSKDFAHTMHKSLPMRRGNEADFERSNPLGSKWKLGYEAGWKHRRTWTVHVQNRKPYEAGGPPKGTFPGGVYIGITNADTSDGVGDTLVVDCNGNFRMGGRPSDLLVHQHAEPFDPQYLVKLDEWNQTTTTLFGESGTNAQKYEVLLGRLNAALYGRGNDLDVMKHQKALEAFEVQSKMPKAHNMEAAMAGLSAGSGASGSAVAAPNSVLAGLLALKVRSAVLNTRRWEDKWKDVRKGCMGAEAPPDVKEAYGIEDGFIVRVTVDYTPQHDGDARGYIHDPQLIVEINPRTPGPPPRSIDRDGDCLVAEGEGAFDPATNNPNRSRIDYDGKSAVYFVRMNDLRTGGVRRSKMSTSALKRMHGSAGARLSGDDSAQSWRLCARTSDDGDCLTILPEVAMKLGGLEGAGENGVAGRHMLYTAPPGGASGSDAPFVAPHESAEEPMDALEILGFRSTKKKGVHDEFWRAGSADDWYRQFDESVLPPIHSILEANQGDHRATMDYLQTQGIVVVQNAKLPTFSYRRVVHDWPSDEKLPPGAVRGPAARHPTDDLSPEDVERWRQGMINPRLKAIEKVRLPRNLLEDARNWVPNLDLDFVDVDKDDGDSNGTIWRNFFARKAREEQMRRVAIVQQQYGNVAKEVEQLERKVKKAELNLKRTVDDQAEFLRSIPVQERDRSDEQRRKKQELELTVTSRTASVQSAKDELSEARTRSAEKSRAFGDLDRNPTRPQDVVRVLIREEKRGADKILSRKSTRFVYVQQQKGYPEQMEGVDIARRINLAREKTQAELEGLLKKYYTPTNIRLTEEAVKGGTWKQAWDDALMRGVSSDGGFDLGTGNTFCGQKALYTELALVQTQIQYRKQKLQSMQVDKLSYDYAVSFVASQYSADGHVSAHVRERQERALVEFASRFGVYSKDDGGTEKLTFKERDSGGIWKNQQVNRRMFLPWIDKINKFLGVKKRSDVDLTDHYRVKHMNAWFEPAAWDHQTSKEPVDPKRPSSFEELMRSKRGALSARRANGEPLARIGDSVAKTELRSMFEGVRMTIFDVVLADSQAYYTPQILSSFAWALDEWERLYSYYNDGTYRAGVSPEPRQRQQQDDTLFEEKAITELANLKAKQAGQRRRKAPPAPQDPQAPQGPRGILFDEDDDGGSDSTSDSDSDQNESRPASRQRRDAPAAADQESPSDSADEDDDPLPPLQAGGPSSSNDPAPLAALAPDASAAAPGPGPAARAALAASVEAVVSFAGMGSFQSVQRPPQNLDAVYSPFVVGQNLPSTYGLDSSQANHVNPFLHEARTQLRQQLPYEDAYDEVPSQSVSPAFGPVDPKA